MFIYLFRYLNILCPIQDPQELSDNSCSVFYFLFIILQSVYPWLNPSQIKIFQILIYCLLSDFTFKIFHHHHIIITINIIVIFIILIKIFVLLLF